MHIRYETKRCITAEQFKDVLLRSTLAERRPMESNDIIKGMVENADLIVTAWAEDLLVGVARSVTDFHYCCYLSDLAVDSEFQKLGIGKTLIAQTRDELGANCSLILLAAPAAAEYYPRLGFTRHPSAWVLRQNEQITGRVCP